MGEALLHINALRKYETDVQSDLTDSDKKQDVSDEGTTTDDQPFMVPMILTDDGDSAELTGDVNDLAAEPTTTPSGAAAVATGEQLTDSQRARLLDLVAQYDSVFTNRLGLTRIASHRITVTTENPPCYQSSYRIPEGLRDDVQQELANMEKNGVIMYDPLATWNSPLVIVRKKNGGIRLCNNFIQLNKHTIGEPYEMTNTSELLNRVAGAKYISKIDMKQAYFQVELEHSSRKYTSFQTPFGTCLPPNASRFG